MTQPDAHAHWRPSGNPWAIAVVVTLAAFMEILDTTIVNVALPHIAGSLSASNDEATWALTSYLVANAIVLTISGWLSAVIGRKRYFMICIAMFTVCSFLCGIANSLPQLVFFRLLQGFFGGGLQPNQQAIILDTFPPEKRGAAFGVTAIATIVAPVIGPTLGGMITDTYNWRWIFFANIPVGIIATFLVFVLVEDPPWLQKASRKHIDFIGLGFITLGLGCLQVMLDRGEDEDWFGSPFIRVMAVLAAFGIVGGIIWLKTAKHPIVNLDVFKDRNFTMGCVCISAVGGVLYAGAVVIPQFAQTVIGYTATWAGLILSPGGLAIIVLIPIVGVLMRFIQTRLIIAAGFFVMGLAFFYSSRLSPIDRFRHAGRNARGANRGPRVPLRPDLDDRLHHPAAPPQRRRDGAVHHVPQRLRLDRHLARDRDDHGADADAPGAAFEMGDALPSTLQRTDREHAKSAGRNGARGGRRA